MDPGTNRVFRTSSEKTRRSAQHLLQQHGHVHQQQEQRHRQLRVRSEGESSLKMKTNLEPVTGQEKSCQEQGEPVLDPGQGAHQGEQGGGGGLLGLQAVRLLLRLLLLQLLVLGPRLPRSNIRLRRYVWTDLGLT